MAARLDHLTVVAPTLAAGAAYVQQALGVTPGPGRRHDGMGTYNLLLSLGPSVYLEVIAPDPQAEPLARPRWFALDRLTAASSARLAAWVASTGDIAAAAIAEQGEVHGMSRAGRSWKITLTPDGELPWGGAVPLLIERSPGPHPASVLPDLGLRLRRLRIRHPEPAQVREALVRTGWAAPPDVTVEHGADCTLEAEIATPAGARRLGGSAP